MITIPKSCEKELTRLPRQIREDLADALARLDEDHFLSMPLSRPMPSISKGVHELRLKDRSGIYRVVYVLMKRGRVYVVHAFKKTTAKMPQHNIKLIKKRLKEILS